jgi:hypothetical protein
MATPISTTTPYCDVETFLDLTDWRTVMQTMGDSDGPANPIRAWLLDDTKVVGRRLLRILMEASGQVEAAVGAAGAYSPTALQELTGASKAFLEKLVRDLALWPCYQRRPDLWSGVPAVYEVAVGLLNAISGGQNVLGLQENIDAGHMELTVDGPCDPWARNSVVTNAFGYFGTRANQKYMPRPCGPCGPGPGRW